MSLRTPGQRPHRDGDRVPQRNLLMAEMKWWQSRNPPGRGGRVHGLLRQSKLLPRSQRANREPPFEFGGEQSVVRSTPTKSLSADQASPFEPWEPDDRTTSGRFDTVSIF